MKLRKADILLVTKATFVLLTLKVLPCFAKTVRGLRM